MRFTTPFACLILALTGLELLRGADQLTAIFPVDAWQKKGPGEGAASGSCRSLQSNESLARAQHAGGRPPTDHLGHGGEK